MILKFGLPALLILILMALCLHWRRQRKKILPAENPESSVYIRQVLYLALAARGIFELRPHLEGGRFGPLRRCLLEEIRPRELVLETEWEDAAPGTWAGAKVSCYFTVTDHKETHYTFDSGIKDMKIQSGGRRRIFLSLPKRLENRQKRSFVRLAPPKEYLLGAALWAGGNMPGKDQFPMPQTWSRPSLIILPAKAIAQERTGKNFKVENFRLDNLSAGGCKLHIPRRHWPASWSYPFQLGEAVVFLNLLDPDGRESLRFWMHSRVCLLQKQTEGMEAGLQFLAWASPGSDKNSKDLDVTTENLDWRTLEQEEDIPGLTSWILRRQLEEEESYLE